MTYFDVAIWTAQPAIIQIHAIVAVLAFLLGTFVFLRRKGDAVHRLAGRGFAVLVVATAGTSLFIHQIQLIGRWSPIHVLSLFVFLWLFQAITAVRRGDISRHAETMQSIYVYGFIIAGAFTFLPDRLLGRMLLARPIASLSGGTPGLESALSWGLPIIGGFFGVWVLNRHFQGGADARIK